MLQTFKEKYKLTLENYLTYKDELNSFKTSKNCYSAQRVKKELELIIQTLPVPTSYEGAKSEQDRWGITAFASYFGLCKWISMEKHTEAEIARLLLRPRQICATFEDIVKDLTENQINGNEFCEKWANHRAQLMNFLEQKEIDSTYVQIFVTAFDDFAKVAGGVDFSLLTDIFENCEKLLANYKNVLAVNLTNDEWENVKTLRKLCDYYNMVIDANGAFNSFDDKFEPLINSLKATVKKELEVVESLKDKNIDKIAHERAVKLIREYQIKKINKHGGWGSAEKLLNKKYNKLTKLIEKCKKKGIQVPFKKLAKFSPVPIVEDYENIYYDKISAREILEVTQTSKNIFDRLFVFEPHKGNHKEFYEMLVEEEMATLNNLFNVYNSTGKTLAEQNMEFVNGVFLPFYVFTATPLLDAMVELVYFGTFEEFKELPPVLQNRSSIDIILNYYKNKCVQTVKEAINLYFEKESVDEDYEPETCNEEETRQMISNSYASEEYRASLTLKKKKQTLINQILG